MDNLNFLPADILLPKDCFEKWAVIACDQFTSEADYWESVKKYVGDAPSSLNITLPEIFLDGDIDNKIVDINTTMKQYLENNVFVEYKNAMIYVERIQSDGTVRHGIVGAIKLADYDYRKGSKALIRATEQTVVERIPPRVKIRKDATLELPHVLLLADDPTRSVIEPLKNIKNQLEVLYDFDLMQDGGHVTGWLLRDCDIKNVSIGFNKLVENDDDKLLFAVGDGNHSLATAKECSEISNYDNAKYALVEVVNVHDEAIVFEPIYRVLFNVNSEKVIDDLLKDFGGEYFGADAQKFTCLYGNNKREISIKPTSKLPVGTLQAWLDNYLADKDIKIDYIHGINTVEKICANSNRLGFIFDGMQKNELFPAVRADGSLPRKTFSMGHANDKRYYIEARKIK